MAFAASGPVSTIESPLVSTIGVTPSARNTWNVVPAGKLLAPSEMLNVSVPVPVFRTTLVNGTLEPGAAGPATGVVVMVRLAAWVTLNGIVFDEPVTVAAPLL